MSRIDGVPEKTALPDVKSVYDRMRDKFGLVPLPLTVTARHAALFRAYTSFEAAFARAGCVDESLNSERLALAYTVAMTRTPVGRPNTLRPGLLAEIMVTAGR